MVTATPLISEEYRKIQQQLHQNPNYGEASVHYAGLVANVLDDLARVTAGVGLFTVCRGPAVKTLPDGRNAHLIQQPPAWWLPKFIERFELATFNRMPPTDFWVVVERKPA